MEETIKEQCPRCKSEINVDATKCLHCQSDLRGFFARHKVLSYVVGGLVVLTVIFFLRFIVFISGGTSPNPPAIPQSAYQNIPKAYILTEMECQRVVEEIIAVVNQVSIEKSILSKNLLEQYAIDAGLPVKNPQNKVRYVMPNSGCGKALDGLLLNVIQGAKSDLSR